ncbi:MAG: hypothetical protein II008_16945 [Oscillospiraceae bacterium]|jgi:hypothetical protein|nr:hypothetical protein [Oscillospiraceae bacterium]
MAWEQDISEQLQEVQDTAVRFDIPQDLTNAQKARAKSNIDITGASVTLISGNDYKINL